MPGSSESGGVPKSTFRVPPFLAAPLELDDDDEDDDDDDEFDDPPHAATANAAPTAMQAITAFRI
jgi:hypothetical protein